MPGKDILVSARVSKNQLFTALREITFFSCDFDHKEWSIYEAECFEDAAKMIRDGYAKDAKSSEVDLEPVADIEKDDGAKAREVAQAIWKRTIGRNQ